MVSSGMTVSLFASSTVHPIASRRFDLNQAGPQAPVAADPDQSASLKVPTEWTSKLFRGCQLVWSSTRILWDQQILLLWILLPPVFLFCGLLVFAAPLFYRERTLPKADNDLVADRSELMAESPQRKAA
jgi:hypothetical protein